jgi:hypothetical protein
MILVSVDDHVVEPPSTSKRPVTMADTMVQLAAALDGQAAPRPSS